MGIIDPLQPFAGVDFQVASPCTFARWTSPDRPASRADFFEVTPQSLGDVRIEIGLVLTRAVAYFHGAVCGGMINSLYSSILDKSNVVFDKQIVELFRSRFEVTIVLLNR